MPQGDNVSPQAVGLPNMETAGELLRAMSGIERGLTTMPPRLIEASGLAFEKNDSTVWKFLQNCGTNVVYWAAGVGAGDVSTTNFHGILAACTAQDDGLGSVVNLSRIPGPIYLYSVSGVMRVAVTECRRFSPNPNPIVP